MVFPGFSHGFPMVFPSLIPMNHHCHCRGVTDQLEQLSSEGLGEDLPSRIPQDPEDDMARTTCCYVNT